MRRSRRGPGLAAVVLVAVVTACGADQEPSVSPASGVERLACLSIEAAQCADIADAIAARYRDVGVVASLTIGSFCQRNPCDLMRLPQPSGYMLVELTGPPRIDGVSVEVAPSGEGESGYAVRGRRGRDPREAHKDRPRVVQFLIAVWAELQRVQWPNRQALVTLTGVVLGFVLIAGGYLGLLDAIFSELIQAIL